MNGMQAKKERKEKAKRFTEDGLPRDGKDWTEDDWRDLHHGVQEIRRRIRERHKGEK